MNQKLLPHIIHISSPDISKQGRVIVLELADYDEAIQVAQKLALETGRRVTVRNGKLALIETIPAASIHWIQASIAKGGRAPFPPVVSK
jgi:hypothetical protein